MEFIDAVAARHMVRSFTTRPVDRATVDRLCDFARRAPSAGHSQGTDLLVLDEPDAVARYWDVTLAPDRRSGFAWPGLLVAPVLVLVAVRPATYVERYGEADKAGDGPRSQPGRVGRALLVGRRRGRRRAHLAGRGRRRAGGPACSVSSITNRRVAAAFGVPDGWRLVATIALGHPREEAARPGRSATRPRRPLAEVVHRNRW